MKQPVFTGTATAMVAPYDDRGLDYKAMARLIDRQLCGGVRALVINGTTGEAATLTEEERTSLLEYTVTYVGGRSKIIAGIGGNNTEAALQAARRAEQIGADGLLLTTPYYNKANAEGLRRHFLTVADGTGLPLIVYNVPGRTAVACTPELYASLAEHPKINGVKEASGDLSLVSRTRRLCGDALNIWSGNDDQTLPMMALGARGVISVASNVVPDRLTALCDAMLSRDLESARAVHGDCAELFELLFSEVNPIPVKTALNRMGLLPHAFRLPLWEMSPEHEAQLCRCLDRMKLLP